MEDTRALWQRVRDTIEVGENPHQVANTLLRRFEIEKPPIDVHAIAKRLGLRVERVRSPGWSGALDSSKVPPVVWIRLDDPIVRQRFTLAHEIGHLLLHPLGQVFRDGSFKPLSDKKEWQANEFASALLMPLWMLEPMISWSAKKRSTEDLAMAFGVATKTMKIQIEKLI